MRGIVRAHLCLEKLCNGVYSSYMSNHFSWSLCKALPLSNIFLVFWGAFRENSSSQICPMDVSSIHLNTSVYIHTPCIIRSPHRDPMESYMFSWISSLDGRIFLLNYWWLTALKVQHKCLWRYYLCIVNVRIFAALLTHA